MEALCCTSMTPKSKRKTIHSRMLRPVSRAFEMEFDLDKALEEVPIHVEDPPLPAGRAEKRSSGFISELPSEEGRKLEHFTKLRPRRHKKQQPTQAAVCATAAAAQDGEQNGLMGRVDEGVDEFFTKKVTRMRSSARGPEAHELSEGGEERKKRESRRSGFLNLIKPRAKSERPPTVLMAEELSSLKGAVRAPAVDTPRRDTKLAEHNGSSERTEEMKTPEALDESQGGDAGRPEPGDGKGSPQGGRRCGVQVMGSGLLAEMKARQERLAAGVHKKLGNDAVSQELSSLSVSTEQLDGGGAGPKLQPAPPETRFSLGAPEKIAKVDPRVDSGFRARSASNPKPALQSPKPSLAARPAVPQKPRAASRAEDAPDSPLGPGSPKVALLPPVLRKVPSDKEREGPGSPQPGPRTPSQEVAQRDYCKRHSDHSSERPSSRGKRSSKLPFTLTEEELDAVGHRKPQPTQVSRRSWGQQPPEPPEQKPWPPSKESLPGSKSSDSGEEAEKEFIFV